MLKQRRKENPNKKQAPINQIPQRNKFTQSKDIQPFFNQSKENKSNDQTRKTKP